MKEERCKECDGLLTGANIVRITDDFAVCRGCNNAVNEEWDDMKTMLRDQGIDPYACTFIEDHLAGK